MTFEDDLLALERRVLTDAAGDFLRAVALLRRMLVTETPGIPAMLERLAIPELEQAVRAGIGEAFGMGGQRALDTATAAIHIGDNAVGDAQMRLDAGIPTALIDPLAGLDGLLADAKARSVALLRSGTPVDVALAPMFGAATTTRLRTVTQINAAANEAALTVGDAVGSPMVWEAERDACVYCLALAGHVIETPGDVFPPADLYADPPKGQWTVTRPPLHGHCRCQIAVLADQSYADALKREAQRSILRGYALGSESQAVRVRAAERLLARDPVAPKSVKDYAARAVREGRFPSRQVPAGDPRLIITGPSGHGPKTPPEPPKAPPKMPKPVISTTAPLRDQLAGMKKPADMQAAAQARHPDIRWEGFDMRGAKPEFAREVLSTVSEMLDLFPGMKLTKISAKLLAGKRIIAQAKAPLESFETQTEAAKYELPYIDINSRFLKDPSSLAAGVAQANESGHFHAVDPGQEARHLVAHEFAHAIDYMTQKKITAAYAREIAAANPYPKTSGAGRAWLEANVSGYGQSSNEEGVAEAISDALLKGDAAFPFSRHFFEIAQRIYREEVPGATR